MTGRFQSTITNLYWKGWSRTGRALKKTLWYSRAMFAYCVIGKDRIPHLTRWQQARWCADIWEG